MGKNKLTTLLAGDITDSPSKKFGINYTILFPITFILAFCSIVYELLLAQALSAFLENTVLRYSVTIGLYMFSMGCGALLMEKRYIKRPVITLLQVEILLTAVGGFVLVLLHSFHLLGLSRFIFSLFAHSLIILIGILTGTEIPLLIEIRNREKNDSENTILGIDYAGAFLGTLIFAFIFYPKIGLVPTAFFTGFLNSIIGISLYSQRQKVALKDKNLYHALLFSQIFLCIVLVICIFYSEFIDSYFITHYLRGTRG